MRMQSRNGKANALFIASIALFIGLCLWLRISHDQRAAGSPKPLLMYCAVAVKSPVEAIARDYERATGVKIELQFGASQSLIANAMVSHTGDLYLPADDGYITLSREKGLLGPEIFLATQHLVLVVKKGNPKGIHQLPDLLRPEVKLAQANPDAAASGKITREILQKTGDWQAIQRHTTVFTGTVVEAANDVKLGTADVAFIWDAMATQYAEMEIIPLEVLKGAESKLIVAVLKSSERPEEALRFARYMGGEGLAWFGKFGFGGRRE